MRLFFRRRRKLAILQSALHETRPRPQTWDSQRRSRLCYVTMWIYRYERPPERSHNVKNSLVLFIIGEALGLPAVAEGEDELVGALLGVDVGGGVHVGLQPVVQPRLVRIATAPPREPAVGPLEQLHGLQDRVPLGLVPVAPLEKTTGLQVGEALLLPPLTPLAASSSPATPSLPPPPPPAPRPIPGTSQTAEASFSSSPCCDSAVLKCAPASLATSCTGSPLGRPR